MSSTILITGGAENMRYAIDAAKITSELGWRAEESFETGIMKTMDWYLENKNPLID